MPHTQWSLVALPAVFVAAYSLLVLVEPGEPWRGLLLILALGSWAGLVLSLIVQFARTPDGSRQSFARSHSADLGAAVFPPLGALSLLRHLPRLPGFRGDGGNALRSRVALRALLYAATFVYVIALTELAVERDAPGATITSFGEAIWWACVTVATVGYGDVTPVTTVGRVLAVVLMAGGLAIIGTASALIVSYLSERIRSREAGERP